LEFHVPRRSTTAAAQGISTDNWSNIVAAGVNLFAEKGFHGTSTREIAMMAGLSPAGMYAHLSSKEALLYEIQVQAHTKILWNFTHALGHEDRISGLKDLVARCVEFETTNKQVARIAGNELRSLAPEHMQEIIKIRHRCTGIVETIIEDGRAAGYFHVQHPDSAAKAVLSILSDISRWFNARGPLTAQDLTARYVELCLTMLGVADAAARVGP
jgi:AcrR family transcriptional regulator